MNYQYHFLKTFLLLWTIFISMTVFSQELKKVSISAKGVNAISYSPDNNYFIMSKANIIQLYNAGNDTRIKEFNGLVHTKDILDVAFNKNGDLLITGGADKKVKLWSVPEGKMLATFSDHTQGVLGVGFADGDKLVIALSEDGIVKAWNRETSSVIYTKQDFNKNVRAFAITRDGKYFAVGGGDKFILVYEAATGSIVKKLEGHTGWVRSLAFSLDGELLASGGDDKIIYLWETQSGNKIKEIKQQGWIYDLEFSGDGKYLAAALEKNAIHFYNASTGSPALKLDKLDFPVLKLSMSPGGHEVASIEEFGTQVYLWNISSLNITPVVHFKDTKDTSAPLILVSNPTNIIDNKAVVYKDILGLRGIVTDESGVRSLKINNIERPVKNGSFFISLPLAMGENYINMEVTDVNDNIALKKFIIVRKNMEGEEYVGATAVNHLFVVSINNYSHWPKLNNAVKDGNDLVSTLLTKYTFEFGNVTVLKDEQATRTNIYNGLRSLIEKVGSKDNLVIYFSGHGFFDPLLNEGYWIPKEANTNSTGEYVSNTDILKILNAINSQHTFLIADACFSGALFSDSRRGYTDQVEKFRSRWGLASGRLEAVSDGAKGSNSPFAKRVIQFLNETEKDKFAISELIQYVKTQVAEDTAEDTNQTPIGNPLKALGDEGGEMVLYKKKN
jgi:WD40 repeat protein